MKKCLSYIVFFLFISTGCYCQVNNYDVDYKPLVSQGLLPEIYTQSATIKANQDLEKLKKDKNAKNKSTKKEFYVISNFHSDKILRSGKVLFNDPVSVFVNKVADETFKSEPELRKQINVFVVKSDVVNAYTFDNGMILISLGLLAQLDNEAQLSFILCHEVSHFKRKHSIDSYVDLSSRNARYSTNSLLDKYKYSQEKELEADVDGIKLFKKTKYSYKGVVGAFNVLKYSHLPFDEIKFEKTFLEDTNLVFPGEYFKKDINPIKGDEDYDDSKSSHPNIKKRKEAVNKELGEFSDEGREKFLVGQDDFYKIRENSRFELCRIELLNRDYAACIYDCFLLTKKYPNNLFLKVTIGKALYQIAAAKSPEVKSYKSSLSPSILDIGSRNSLYYDYSDIEGNSQQVYHLFDKINDINSSVLALNYNWKLRKELQGNNQDVNTLCDSLFVLLAVNNDVDLTYFSELSRSEYEAKISKKDSVVITNDTLVKKDSIVFKKKFTSLEELDTDEKDTKTNRIDQQTVKQDAKATVIQFSEDSINRLKLETEFETYVFAEFLKEESFLSKYKAARDIKDEINSFANKVKLKSTSEKKNKGGMGIEKIIILDPFYMKFDERTSNEVKYFASDDKLDEFGEILKKNAALAELNCEYLDSKSLKPEDVEKYNDFTLLNDWMNEYLNHGLNNNMLVLNNDAAKQIKSKYNTRFVLWSGVMNVKMKKEYLGLAVLCTFFLYPAPFTIPYLLRKEEKTLYVSVLFDLETNKIIYFDSVALRLSDTKDFLNAFVYDTMLSIRKEPKYK